MVLGLGASMNFESNLFPFAIRIRQQDDLRMVVTLPSRLIETRLEE